MVAADIYPQSKFAKSATRFLPEIHVWLVRTWRRRGVGHGSRHSVDHKRLVRASTQGGLALLLGVQERNTLDAVSATLQGNANATVSIATIAMTLSMFKFFSASFHIGSRLLF